MIILHDNLCLIGLPDGAYKAAIIDGKMEHSWYDDERTHGFITLPPGSWKLIGIDSEEQPLSEEGCKEVVKRQLGQGKYYDYVKAELSVGQYGAYFCNTARESFASLKEHLKIYTRNPFGEKEPERVKEYYFPREDGKIINPYSAAVPYGVIDMDWIRWHTAQQRTFKQWAVIKRQ